MELKDFFTEIVDKIKSNTGAQTVYGEPVKSHDKVIIPVSKVSYGFGGGFGKGQKGSENQDGEGAGGGGGLKVEPVGVMEITKYDTRFVPVNTWKKMAAVFAVGLVVGKLFFKSKKSTASKKTKKK